MRGVTEWLTARLRASSFDFAADQTDWFYVPSDRQYLSGQRYESRLRLSRGLISTADVVPVAVAVAGTRAQMLAGDVVLLAEVGEDPADFISLDAETGVVTIQDYRLFDQYVRCVYDAGIEVDPATSNLYLQTGTHSVPGWLAEAAILKTIVNLSHSPSFGGSDSNKIQVTRQMAELCGQQLEDLLDQHTRFDPDALRPI